MRGRWVSKLCPWPAEEARARRGQSLSSSWTRSFLPSEPGIQNGEGMLASTFLSWCLFYSGNSLCLALPSCNVTYHSLAKGIRVLQAKKSWTKTCIHDEPGIHLASKSRCPNNDLRANGAYIHLRFPLYPQSFILLQKSTHSIKLIQWLYDWLFITKLNHFKVFVELSCWPKARTTLK